MTQKEIWYETLHTGFGQYFSVEKVLYREKTDHQDLVIFENPVLGRVMALDGVVQTTERDEFIYHEMLTHVPLLAHGQAKKVLIIGGGDGGMLREVSRHPGVEQITMVEIDAGVVEFCRQYLPNHSAGAYDDPRFQVGDRRRRQLRESNRRNVRCDHLRLHRSDRPRRKPVHLGVL